MNFPVITRSGKPLFRNCLPQVMLFRWGGRFVIQPGLQGFGSSRAEMYSCTKSCKLFWQANLLWPQMSAWMMLVTIWLRFLPR